MLEAIADMPGDVFREGLAAILIGCEEGGARAFVRRFESALNRMTHDRPVPVRPSYAVLPLAGTPSPTDALDLAEPVPWLEEETTG